VTPSRGVAGRSDLWLGLFAALIAVGAAGCALLISPRFFLTDDYATYFMPGFREIARLVWSGQAPLITDRVWSGGALLQEYQYAVFNPVSLALYVAVGQTHDLALSAAIFSLVHIAILAGGAYFLARQVLCGRKQAFLVGVLAPLADQTFAWGATNWIPALVSLAWLSWAWGLLILAARRRGFAPLAAIAVALTLVSGWPFADLALVLSLLAAGGVSWGRPGRFTAAAPIAMAVFAGLLLAAPAILPLVFYAPSTGRHSIVSTWAANLPSLLGFGVPLFATQWSRVAQTAQFVAWPTAYVAWFAPIALANADWKALWTSPLIRTVVFAAALFGALAMAPGLSLFRWMFRLLPYYQLALLLLAARALTQSEMLGRHWSLVRSLIVVDAEIWLAICQSPPSGLIAAYLAIAVCLSALAWLGARLAGRPGPAWFAVVLSSSLACFALTLAWMSLGGYPRFPNRWSPPTAAQPASAPGAAGPTRLALFSWTDEADPGPTFWRTFRPGNTALQGPGVSILGYSPMISRGYSNWLCEGHFGADCDDIATRVFRPTKLTNTSLVDLAGVDQVDVERAADATAFAARVGSGWRESRAPDGAWRFLRLSPSGRATWTTPMTSAAVRQDSLTRIALDVRNDTSSSGIIVIARAWYPNWRATLNGRPVHAWPLAGVVLAVEAPPRASGRLEVSFWPAGLTAGLIAAALGILLIALMGLYPPVFDLIQRTGRVRVTSPASGYELRQ
jgi:hypothetical protein